MSRVAVGWIGRRHDGARALGHGGQYGGTIGRNRRLKAKVIRAALRHSLPVSSASAPPASAAGRVRRGRRPVAARGSRRRTESVVTARMHRAKGDEARPVQPCHPPVDRGYLVGPGSHRADDGAIHPGLLHRSGQPGRRRRPARLGVVGRCQRGHRLVGHVVWEDMGVGINTRAHPLPFHPTSVSPDQPPAALPGRPASAARCALGRLRGSPRTPARPS